MTIADRYPDLAVRCQGRLQVLTVLPGAAVGDDQRSIGRQEQTNALSPLVERLGAGRVEVQAARDLVLFRCSG